MHKTEQNTDRYILTSEGRLLPTANGFEREYFLTDHLGNTRVVFKKSGDSALIVQENHYYAYGMEISDQSFSSTPVHNSFLYNGKEYDGNTGYYQYGFRQYDAQIGRWHVVDPLAGKYYSTSPYAYVTNNPVNSFDVMGLYKSTYQQTMDQWYGSGNYWYRGQAPGTWQGELSYYHKGSQYYNSNGENVTWNEVFGFLRNTGQAQSLTRTQAGWAGQGMILSWTGATRTGWEEENGNYVFKEYETYWVCRLTYLNSDWQGYSERFEVNNYNEWRINDAFSLAGLAWGVNESVIYNKAYWLAKNGKYYSTELWKYGNQYTGNSFEAMKLAKPAKILGRLAFVVNLTYGGYGMISGAISKDYSKVIFSGLGTSYSALATFGGPAGLFIGGPMVAIDATIGLDKFFQNSVDLHVERALRMSQGDYSMMWYTPGRTIR